MTLEMHKWIIDTSVINATCRFACIASELLPDKDSVKNVRKFGVTAAWKNRVPT